MARQRSSGSVQQMADGTWEARLRLPADPGRDRPARRITRRARTQEAAQEALRELRLAAAEPKRAEILRAANATTVRDYLPRWRNTLAAEVADGQIREQHAADCLRRVTQYLLPGTRRLSDLRPADFDAISARMHANGLARNTRRHVLLACRKMLTAAAAEGLVADWVPATIKLPKQEQAKVRPAPDDATYGAVLAALLADLDRHPAALLSLLAAGSSARRAEVCGARVQDIDLATGFWTVRTSLTWTDGIMHEHRPKNGEERTIPLPEFVLAALRTARRTRPFQTWIAEWPDVPGEPVHVDCLSAYYPTLAASLGAPTGLHSLRRYVITRLLDVTDGDLDATATISGHKSVETLRKHYVTHRDNRVAAAMNAAFSKLA